MEHRCGAQSSRATFLTKGAGGGRRVAPRLFSSLVPSNGGLLANSSLTPAAELEPHHVASHRIGLCAALLVRRPRRRCAGTQIAARLCHTLLAGWHGCVVWPYTR